MTEYAPPIGEIPHVRWEQCCALMVDHAYQRMADEPASQRLIRQIAENWDWRLCAPLTVSHRDDGEAPGFYVIDGQHRLRAAEMRGDIYELPCIISKFGSLEDEARLFVAVNSNRRQVGEIEKFHARVAAKDESALAVKELVISAGLTIARYTDAQFWQPLQVGFPNLLEKAVGINVTCAAIALNILAAAYPTKPLLRGKDIFEGIEYLTRNDFLGNVAPAKVAEVIGGRLQRAWVNERDRLRDDKDHLSPARAMANVIGKALEIKSPASSDSHNQRRFETIPPGSKGLVLAADHPAAVEGRTVFPSKVVDAADVQRIFKSGEHNRKIGKVVEKGIWEGFPIFTLTLEERDTCPATCKNLLSCYGNNMHHSERLKPGKNLETFIWSELRELQDLHPGGFVIRLHVLGDFYSLDYIKFWQECLNAFPALHVYGYTAHAPDSDEGGELLGMALEQWERFAMRFSGSDLAEMGALVIEPPETTCPDDAFICPAQKMKIACCAACTLCWESERNVAFLRH